MRRDGRSGGQRGKRRGGRNKGRGRRRKSRRGKRERRRGARRKRRGGSRGGRRRRQWVIRATRCVVLAVDIVDVVDVDVDVVAAVTVVVFVKCPFVQITKSEFFSEPKILILIVASFCVGVVKGFVYSLPRCIMC